MTIVETLEQEIAAPRIATETIEHEIDGVNTVIAQEGQPVPLAFAHLVPDSKTRAEGDEDTTYADTRSTGARRRAHAARAAEQDAEVEKPKRGSRKAADDGDTGDDE